MIHLANKTQLNWSDILSKFSTYQGTITSFCKENNINAHQLYYQRRKLAKNDSPVFHGIKVSEKDFTFPDSTEDKPSLKENAHIKVEIGKAKIYIPSNDKQALENILQIVMSTC